MIPVYRVVWKSGQLERVRLFDTERKMKIFLVTEAPPNVQIQVIAGKSIDVTAHYA